MRKVTLIVVVVGSCLLALGSLPALAAGWGASYGAPASAKAPMVKQAPMEEREPMAEQEGIFPRVDAQVTAIDRTASPMMLTVRVMQGKTAHTLRLELTDTTTVQQGLFTRSLDAVKVGDHIYLDYERDNGKLIADEIGILNPPVAVMGTEGPDIKTT
jgi:hypothetical protein